jgi:hypothetical protein
MVLRSRKRILVFHPHQPIASGPGGTIEPTWLRGGSRGFGNTDGSQIAGPGRFFRFAIG